MAASAGNDRADHIELPDEFALFRKIPARMNMLKREIALSCQQHRASAFTQDHPLGRPRERLDRWLRAEQPPLAIGVAEQPVGFLCADHQAAVQSGSAIKSSAIFRARIPTAPSPTSV